MGSTLPAGPEASCNAVINLSHMATFVTRGPPTNQPTRIPRSSRIRAKHSRALEPFARQTRAPNCPGPVLAIEFATIVEVDSLMLLRLLRKRLKRKVALAAESCVCYANIGIPVASVAVDRIRNKTRRDKNFRVLLAYEGPSRPNVVDRCSFDAAEGARRNIGTRDIKNLHAASAKRARPHCPGGFAGDEMGVCADRMSAS